MIETLRVRRTVDVPGEDAWAAISGIGGLDRWFPVIASCRVEGRGVGAIRILGLDGGGEIRDRIEEVDHRARRLRYLRSEHPFPVQRYVGTVEVADRGGDRADVTWSVEIDITEQARDEFAAFLTSALSDGIAGLERDLRSTARTGLS